MPDDDSSSPNLAEKGDASEETAITPVPEIDVLALADANAPAFVQAELLVDGMRYLQKRIPGFTQLTLREKQSHSRAAHLNPEFFESGLHAAEVWHNTKSIVNRTAEELREEQEEIERWDKTVLEIRAVADGIESANLKRKHHLGKAILQLYRTLGACLRNHGEDDYMRPYYEAMQRAYQRRKQARQRQKKEEPAAE